MQARRDIERPASPALRHLGRRLRRARLARGLSQQDILAAAGIPVARLDDIEQGCAQVRGSELCDLAKVYDMPFDYFTAHLSSRDADGQCCAGDRTRRLGHFDTVGRAVHGGGEGAPSRQATPIAATRPCEVRGPANGPKVAEEPGRVVLTWDAETISTDALRAMKSTIEERADATRFTLRFNFGGWAEEHLEGREHAVARIEQVMSYAAGPWPADIRIDPQPPSEAQTSRIRRLLRLWRDDHGSLNHAGERHLGDLLPYLLIFDELRYRHIGEASLFARVAGERLAEDCLGRRYEYDPAQEAYSRAVCREYEAVLRRSQPSYQHVCARVYADSDYQWLIYQRLIAPFTCADGRPILAVLCDQTQNVSIPFLRGEAN